MRGSKVSDVPKCGGAPGRRCQERKVSRQLPTRCRLYEGENDRDAHHAFKPVALVGILKGQQWRFFYGSRVYRKPVGGFRHDKIYRFEWCVSDGRVFWEDTRGQTLAQYSDFAWRDGLTAGPEDEADWI